MKFFKKTGLVFLAIILFLFVFLWFFLVTDHGIHLILRGITYYVPDLKIGSISGNWLRGITIKDLYYQKHGVLIRSSELYISLDLTYLFDKYFCVNSLSFKDLFACIESSNFDLVSFKDSNGKQLIHIFKSYRIIFRNIILNNVYIKFDGMSFALNKCITGFVWNKKSFVISSTFFSGLKLLSLSNFSKIDMSAIQVISLQKILSHKFFLSDIFNFLSDKFFLKKRYMRNIIPCDLILERIEGEDLFLFDRKDCFIKKICMQGMISRECMRLVLLDIIFSDGEISAKGTIKFNKKYSVNVIVNCFLGSFFSGKEKISFVISGYLDTTLCIFSEFLGVLNGRLILKVQLTEVNIPFSLMLDIDRIYYSFINGWNYLIKGVNFNVNGNFNSYQLNLKFVISSLQLLSYSYDVVMSAIGDVDHLLISTLNCKSSDNNLDITGIIKHQNFVDWKIDLFLKKINFSQCHYIWPINVCGEIHIWGNYFNHIWRLKLFDIFLYGTVHSCHSINFRFCIVKDIFNKWIIPKFLLSVGSNTMKIVDDFNNKSLLITVQFFSLNDLFLDLYGSVSLKINIFRYFEYSNIFLDMFIKSFNWKDYNLNIDYISVSSNLQYKDIIRGRIKCEVNNLEYYSIFFPKITCQVIGDIKHHSLEFLICTDLLDIILSGQGSVNSFRRNWNASLLKIIYIKRIMNLNYLFNQRLAIFYRNLPNRITFSTNYLDDCKFEINFPALSDGMGMKNVILFFQDIHLTIKQSFFLRSSKISGTCIFYADLVWNKYTIFPCGKIFLSCNKMQWDHVFLGKISTIVFENFFLNIFFGSGSCSFNWLLKTKSDGECYGELKILLFNQYKFLGNIYTKDVSLFFLNLFLESNDIIGGVLNFNLRFNGDLFHPEIYGMVKLENIILRGDHIPFVMLSSKFLINFNKNNLVLSGMIRTTHGMLYVSGNSCWNSLESIYARIYFTGRNVRWNVSSIAKVDVSYFIVLEITSSKLIFRGSVDIPSGYIKLKEHLKRDNICTVSSDEVILFDNIYRKYSIFEEYKYFFIKNGDITVRFGDNVRISAFGLDAKINGNLEVIYDEHGVGLKGLINILEGSFNVYSQNLFIKKGQLLFFGLIDNQPYLNIEAVYNSNLIKKNFDMSSIRVTGFINAPEIEFLSDRFLFQEKVISYFSSRKRLDIMSMNINNTIRSILIRLGLSHTEKFIRNFGRVLGVRDLSLDTYGFGDKSQIVLSGYIVPGLQIKYGFGIFDSLAVVTVRYCLFPNFYLEATSGTSRIFDLIYRFNY